MLSTSDHVFVALSWVSATHIVFLCLTYDTTSPGENPAALRGHMFQRSNESHTAGKALDQDAKDVSPWVGEELCPPTYKSQCLGHVGAPFGLRRARAALGALGLI